MIIAHYGNVLDVPKGIIVHGCNDQGVMGAGIAREIRERYPAVYGTYLDHMKKYKKADLLGTISVTEVAPDKYIVNAITQTLGTGKSREVDYDAIARCFEKINDIGEPSDLRFPMIGAGLGGGNWSIISNIIEHEITRHYKHLYLLKADHGIQLQPD
jgi:O-acetyl-ADP-ribose deacetylase (regulator of RNase III)